MFSNVVGAIPGGVSTYGEVLRRLEPDSEILDNISERFNRLLDQSMSTPEPFHVCSFQEGQGMASVKGASSKVRLTSAAAAKSQSKPADCV